MRKSLPIGLLLAAAVAFPATGDEPPAGTEQPGGTVPQAGAPPPLPPPPVTGPSTPSKRVLYRDGHGGRYLIDGTWFFRGDPQDVGLGQGFARQEGLEGWAPVAVPNAWNATDLSDASQRGTVGWYRKDFKVPGRGSGRWKFRFESVNYRGDVFLNGKRIGSHEGAYIPWEVDASGLKRGVNRLVVRVDNRRGETDVPPMRDQTNGKPGGGWWNYGGILREVYLRRMGRLDIEELLARPILPCRRCAATVLVKATVRNPGRGTRTASVNASVGGRRVRMGSVKIGPRGTREVSGRIRFGNPRLWWPDRPALYRVRASAGGSSYSTHIGIRSIRVNRRGRMLLNGRPVQLRGASVHEDHPQVGAAWTPEIRRQTFNDLRALGATMTRAHYPLHPEFLEMADREGIMVYDQIPFYQIRTDLIRLKSIRAKGLDYLEAMIRRDQNHASVFNWSVGNELGARVGLGQERYITAAVNRAKKLDPTRTVSIDFAGYPSIPPNDAYREFDALGMNSYFGWYPGPNGQIIDRELLGPYLDQVHDYYPTEALFITEFGAEANRPGPIDEKGSFEFQRDLMQFHIEEYDRKPFVNGAVNWILKDFRVRPDWDGGNPKPRAPVNHKGLIDENGNRKPAFDETARMYRQTRPVR